MKVLMIGAGNMGLTFAEGLVSSPTIEPGNLFIHDKNVELLKKLSVDERFTTFEQVEEAVPLAHVLFLAVKPYHCEELFAEIKPYLKKDQIIVSLMAGVTLDYIQESTGLEKIIRAMPNLPAKVGKGVTAFTETEAVSKIEQITIRSLLDSTGVAIHVENETFINKSTAISGSGPAYVFYFMQSMFEAAQKMGFSANDSKVLISNTFEGAVQLFKASDISPQTWINRVSSKGGTTEAAIDSMKDNDVSARIKEAAYAAFERAVELGEETR